MLNVAYCNRAAFSSQILLVLWTYFAAVLTDPGRVPPDWHPFVDEQVGVCDAHEGCLSHTCTLSSL